MQMRTEQHAKACALISVLAVLAFTFTTVLAFATDSGKKRSLNLKDGLNAGTLPMVVGESDRKSGRTAALTPGDRIKITFYELVDVGEAGGRGTLDTSLRTFFQRMDLSAEFTIEQDGAITLPRLGTFGVAERTPSELQAELASAFKRTIGRTADVNIIIVERRPIFVIGPVRNAGSFKFIPDMMVVQALALAGGVVRADPADTSVFIEGSRELERVSRLNDRLKRLLARAARLEAERDGASTISAPEQLVALIGQEAAHKLLGAERSQLRLNQLRFGQQQTEAGTSVEATRKEVQALRAKLKPLETQRQIRDDHLQDMQKLRNVGLTSRRGVVTTQTEVADIEARRQDLNAALATAEARLTHAERARARLSLEQAANTLAAIATTEADIADTRLSLASAEKLALYLTQKSSGLSQASALVQPTFQILRNGMKGATTIPADETTALLPGDVLKVSLDPPKGTELMMHQSRSQEVLDRQGAATR